MMEQTKIYKALGGVRGRKPVDLAALEQILVRFARLVVEQPRIREIDINPMLVSDEQLVALDARVVLFPADVPDAKLPRPVVRPYPTQYVVPWTASDGTKVMIRPIRPEDEPLLVKFHETLSERSVQLRYFHPMKLSGRVAHERLSRICFNDYDREMALVVEHRIAGSDQREIVGIGRLSKLPGGKEAELAVVISDLWQKRGLGTELARRLLQVARDEGVVQVNADILGENREMQSLCSKLGFRLERRPDENTVLARIALR
jgi:acetyltransferase